MALLILAPSQAGSLPHWNAVTVGASLLAKAPEWRPINQQVFSTCFIPATADIQHPIYRQLPEHDQLCNPQQRPGQRRHDDGAMSYCLSRCSEVSDKRIC